jgi:hypothetical protein
MLNPTTGLYSATLDYLLAPAVLTSLQPRVLSNIIYAVASAPADVRREHAAAVVSTVLPVLLLKDKLQDANAQVGLGHQHLPLCWLTIMHLHAS